MNTNVDPRAASRASNTPKQDLRAWLAEMEAAGEVVHISGAEREREIGGIVDIYQRKIGNPLVLFDDIPGYPKGHRILANLLTSIRRMGLPHQHSGAASYVTLSFGLVAARPERGMESAELIEMADRLLYQAKAEGRNRIKTGMLLPIQAKAI